MCALTIKLDLNDQNINANPLIQLISLAFLLRLSYSNLQAYLNGLKLMKQLAVSLILKSSLKFFFSYAFILAGFGISGVILGFIGALFANILFLTLIRKPWHAFVLNTYFDRVNESYYRLIHITD